MQAKTKQATLNKIGFMRTTANEVACQARQHGGLGLRGLHVEKGTAQPQLLASNVILDSEQGTMIKLVMDWGQQAAGLDHALHEHPGRK